MTYVAQFDSTKPHKFTVMTQERAEEVAAWFLAHNTNLHEADYNAPKIRRLDYTGAPLSYDEPQRKLETVYRAEFLAAFPELDVDYNGGLKWIVDVNTVMSNWDAWERDATLKAQIESADIPEALRVYLMSRWIKNERIDATTAKEGFKPREMTLDSGVKVKAYHVAYYQEAYGDRNEYVYFDGDTLKTTGTYYSIGD